jgi:hypothetical protein
VSLTQKLKLWTKEIALEWYNGNKVWPGHVGIDSPLKDKLYEFWITKYYIKEKSLRIGELNHYKEEDIIKVGQTIYEMFWHYTE